MNSEYFGKVAFIKSNYEVVINKGSDHGVGIGDKFIIYKLSDEVIDPDTNQSLGFLEDIKGTGVVTHIQEKIATLESNDYIKESDKTEIVKTKKNNSLYSILSEGVQETTKIIPGSITKKDFTRITVGDFVKKK